MTALLDISGLKHIPWHKVVEESEFSLATNVHITAQCGVEQASAASNYYHQSVDTASCYCAGMALETVPNKIPGYTGTVYSGKTYDEATHRVRVMTKGLALLKYSGTTAGVPGSLVVIDPAGNGSTVVVYGAGTGNNPYARCMYRAHNDANATPSVTTTGYCVYEIDPKGLQAETT